jgi:hypothetical protein
MRPDLTRFLVADESDIKILVVVGEVRLRSFRRRCAVAGRVLAKIRNTELGFARMILKEVSQFGRAMDAGNFR